MKARTAKHIFVVPLALGLLLAPLATDAQQAGTVHQIGVLANFRSPATDAFEQGLRDLGYVEGKSIVIEWRLTQGRFERLPELAAELVRLKVDVIVAAGTPGPIAAKQATRTIPIVMGGVGDAVASGIVASLARPGGNITGLSLISPELGGKRLELLKEVVPKLRRVAILWNPANPSNPLQLRETETAAWALGVQLQPLEARVPNDFERAFETAIRGRAGALIALDDPLTYGERTRIVELAAKSRLPAMYGFREHAEAGGLMSYGASLPDLWRRAATYVDKILKGAKPADLPVEQPTRFELVINLKTAKALGLTIPQSVLVRADQVIQ